jgi:S1-C subfamily serine protease
VIGVNTAISAEGEGVGFAIPINEVKQAVKDVEEVGRIVRPWLGVRFVMIDEAFAQENELSETHGALLVPGEFPDEPAVVPDSPAAAASLQVDDILLSIDGVDLTFEHSLAEAIRSHRPGDTVTITVKRGEETFDVEVTLAEFESN